MSKAAVENLEQNPIWREIVDTLKEVMEGLKIDAMHLDPISEVEIARIQGRYIMAEFVLAQPLAILRELEETAKIEERKEGT